MKATVTAQALAAEFGPANATTHALIGRLVATREGPLPPQWCSVYGSLDDPRGELAAVLRDAYGVPGRHALGELLFGVHSYFALVARLIANGALGESDDFAWCLDLPVVDELRDRVEPFAIDVGPGSDVLRDLYQQLLPPRLRRALGEFLTPQWLAGACLRRLEAAGAPLGTGRVLDPTCGTGTFLLPVLSRRLAALRASGELTAGGVQAVLDTVAGYDLNPVAVLAARANLALAVGALAGEVTLPIRQADATRDAPGGEFDVIVGNPPWIGWRKLPAQRRGAGMADWKRLGLWRPPPEAGQRPAKPQMGDLATLVYATAVARHAAPGGYVGMLVPNSLVSGDPSGRAFRRFELGGRRFAPVHVDFWNEVNPFAPDASNQPIFLVSRVDERCRFPVAASRWRRAPSGLAEARGHCWPVDRDVPTSSWSFVQDGSAVLAGGANGWQFGVGLHTRGANGIYFVEVLSTAPDAAGAITVANDHTAGRHPDVERRPGRVEAGLVYPVLRGREVSRWRAEPAGHVLAPYRQDAMGTALTDFAGAFPDGHRWLSAFRPILERRRLVATLRWDLEGDDWGRLMGTEHMTGAPCVVVREIARRPAAAVVLQRHDRRLGRRATVLIDHKLLYCAVATEDEAHYLAAMINATPMQDLLASFLNVLGVAPSTLGRLPIPPYDAIAAAPLVAAAKDAAAGVDGADSRVDDEARRLIVGTSLPARQDLLSPTPLGAAWRA